MKKNLFKITVLAIVGLVFISTSFAQPSKKENAKVKNPSYEKFVPGQLPEFDEVTGTISVEGKGENQKVYILTDKKTKVLVEVAGGPRFAFEQRPFVEKKDFPNENRPDSKKDFNKDKKGENSKDFEKGNFEKPKNFNSLESLTKLKGKKVSLVGKYNSEKTVFNVIGIINK